MRRPEHPRRIEPTCLHLREQLLVKGFVDLRRTAQDPEIVTTRFTDHGVLIIRTKVQNPILAVKRPEESNFQLSVRFLIDNLRLSCGSGELTRNRATAIHYLNAC